jgi:hypothetical protein
MSNKRLIIWAIGASVALNMLIVAKQWYIDGRCITEDTAGKAVSCNIGSFITNGLLTFILMLGGLSVIVPAVIIFLIGLGTLRFFKND